MLQSVTVLPERVESAADRSAAPDAVRLALSRLADERPELTDRLVDGSSLTVLGRALISVIAASRSLTRLCLADGRALDVLDHVQEPVELETGDIESLARSKHLELLRIAAMDLLGSASLEETTAALSRLAEGVLDATITLAGGPPEGFTVIGMGKLGGGELNYASDVDVMFVTSDQADETRARKVLTLARSCFRVDANLRPDGRSGPLTRSVQGYRSYWAGRAATWEMQALIKARPVAGDTLLGKAFETAVSEELWGRTYSADELVQVRIMKARSEEIVARRGLASREIKRGPGGIRDIEFAVQLLQLVHGRSDDGIRDRSTLGALRQLADAGYIASPDSESLSNAYRFLRTVEHRLQIVEEEQTHSVPSEQGAHQRLARVLEFRDSPSSTASASFDSALGSFQQEVRAVHERLFFRPLLDAFASMDAQSALGLAGTTEVMDQEAVSERLAAFGFSDAGRTRAAVDELATGLTRSSRLMGQLLPLLLNWLSLTPDPDLGLVGLRNLTVHPHHRSIVVSTFRDSPEAARRLCVLLGSSRVLTEYVSHNPELVAAIADDDALAAVPREELLAEARLRIHQREGEAKRSQLIRLREEQVVKIAERDLLGADDVRATAASLSALADVLVEASLSALAPDISFCVVGMGRFGGSELSYASDLDVLFVFDDAGREAAGTEELGQSVAEELLHFMKGPSPARQLAPLDLGLRPEGGQGRLARGLGGYSTYFARWAQTWERQALLRARIVAGDRGLGERFLAMVAGFVFDRSLTPEEVSEIRRMKARMERERISPREDPEFHLKLGKGSLSDVEWTVQLLQLRHRVAATGTLAALEQLTEREALGPGDAEVLRNAYEFLERTRNRWYLVGALPGGGGPGDSLPAQGHHISRLARSLETTPAALRDDYRRVTRRARRVTERLFYGVDG